MGRCANCGESSPLISEGVGICGDCIRNDFPKVTEHLEGVHQREREGFGLPGAAPKTEGGVNCAICVNECRVGLGEKGFCGIRKNQDGKLVAREGLLDWYYDPLPTNCVGDWVCAGGTAAGYPEYSYGRKAEYGYNNLAVFYRACSFDCLFCQNWHFRESSPKRRVLSPQELAEKANWQTSCICYFGGDPTPQISHSIRASEIALQNKESRILRICWETNGSMSPKYLKRMAEISLETGGCIKFDLKFYSESLNLGICGATNERTLSNFAEIAPLCGKRPDPPLLLASTLLVPGYVDEEEVRGIARFIASLNPEIPYSLLGFYPHFLMSDLPTTSRNHAQRALEVARKEGLQRVRIGNSHLLSDAY